MKYLPKGRDLLANVKDLDIPMMPNAGLVWTGSQSKEAGDCKTICHCKVTLLEPECILPVLQKKGYLIRLNQD